ncbi:glycosyl hydrolase [Parvularcula sp. LCG005]|uniref:glycosyl hydrolase n=1 Tax=Parvularcula sp. LCG005 TaxID=3078805 RepID=UPI002943E406|nr:glycosyl hydrolase [Parvularcula sp. LCG005]WOI53461.1 glycosyl hydrolase [Parvularcula sp. LCG005]
MSNHLFRQPRTALAAVALATCFTTGPASASAVDHHKTSPDFDKRASTVMDYLSGLTEDGKTLAGTQVNEYEVFLKCDSMDRLVQMTGAEPAVLGLELMFANEYPPFEDYFVDHAVTHSRQGGLVTVAWHQRNPLKVCMRGEFYTCSQTAMTAEELDRMLTPGTPEHDLWKADVDVAARTLKRLEDEGVLVFFRPYHEMNGGWFWWGQKDAYPQLWDALYEVLVEEHGLTNLVWVWSGNRATEDAPRYWPEKHKPDIIATDVYETDSDSASFYDGATNIKALAPDTLFALTEVGKAPSDKVLAETQPAWVLIWGGNYLNADWTDGSDSAKGCDGCNTMEETMAFFANERIVDLTEMPKSVRKALAGEEPEAPAERPYCPATLLESN